jgi:hypothetical protein
MCVYHRAEALASLCVPNSNRSIFTSGNQLVSRNGPFEAADGPLVSLENSINVGRVGSQVADGETRISGTAGETVLVVRGERNPQDSVAVR